MLANKIIKKYKIYDIPVKIYFFCICVKDLSTLYSFINDLNMTDDPFYRKVGMTIFAPTDSVFSTLPIDLQNVEFKNKTENMRKMFDFHIVAPRIVRKTMIREGRPYKSRTRLKGQNLVVTKTTDNITENININDVANVRYIHIKIITIYIIHVIIKFIISIIFFR